MAAQLFRNFNFNLPGACRVQNTFMSEIKGDGVPYGAPVSGHVRSVMADETFSKAPIDRVIQDIRGGENPFVDIKKKFGFRRAFCTADGVPELIGLLNSVIRKGEPLIEQLYPFSVHDIGQADAECLAVYDFYGKDQLGRVIAVDMQDDPVLNIKFRSNYYACRALKALCLSQFDYEYDQVGVLSFLFIGDRLDIRPGSPVVRHYIQADEVDKKSQIGGITLTTVELGYFDIRSGDIAEKDTYLYLLKRMGSLTSVPGRFAGERFRSLFDRVRIDHFKYGEAFRYLAHLKAEELKFLEITHHEIKTARFVKELTTKRTTEKVKAACKEEFANTLMAYTNFDIEQVAKLTGLPVEKVSDLKQEGQF